MKGLKLDKSSIGVITVLLAALTMLSSLAIDSFLPGMPLMATFFNVDINIVELIITIYFLGFAVGNFFGGPLSDAYGRKTIALLGVGIYAVSALTIPLCKTIEWVLVLRFLQSFGGGFATVTANLFIRDWYKGKQVARLITITAMIMMLIPMLAPVLGGFLLKIGNWQLIFYFLFAFAILLFIVFYLLIPESREQELITKKLSVNDLFFKYKVFLSDKKAVVFLFAMCFPISGMYVFISSASFIYLEFFKKEVSLFPLLFGSNVFLNVILSFSNTYLLRVFETKKLFKVGINLQLVAGFFLFTCVMLGWIGFWNVFLSMVVFIGSIGLIFGNGSAILLEINPEISGVSNAAIGITRFVLGFLTSTIIAIFHTENLIPVAIGMFFCTLMGNIFFLLYTSTRTKNTAI